MAAGSINLGSYNTPDGVGVVTLSLLYDAQANATQFSITNNGASAVFKATLQGLNADGTPNANAVYSGIAQPNGAAAVTIPTTGTGAIPLTVNVKGKLSGFNLTTG